MDGEHLGKRVSDGLSRIKGTDRVLKNHLYGATRHGGKGRGPGGDGLEAAERFCKGALAATGFPDDAEELVFTHIERYAFDGAERRLPGTRILNDQIGDGKDGVHFVSEKSIG